MSQISLKSISGITSITTPAGVDNQLTVHTNDTTQRVKVTQSGIDVTGVVTATTFSGSGASLTNLPSAQLTGALPALDGSNLTGISAGTSLSGSTNNTVTTVTGANAIQGEANLTFDGDTLLLKSSTDGRRVSFAGDGTSHYMKYDNTLGGIILNGYGGIAFETNGTNERLRIKSDGKVNITPGGALSGSHPSGDLNIVGTNFLTMTPNDNANASDNEVLGRIAFLPYAAASIAAASAKIEAVAVPSQSGSANPSMLTFYTKPSSTGPGSSPTERLRITSTGDVEPSTDNIYDFGSLTKRWANIYTADLNLSNEGKANDVDGTWGQYTIQEGQDDLYLINKRNGKKYKFLLQEVT